MVSPMHSYHMPQWCVQCQWSLLFTAVFCLLTTGNTWNITGSEYCIPMNPLTYCNVFVVVFTDCEYWHARTIFLHVSNHCAECSSAMWLLGMWSGLLDHPSYMWQIATLTCVLRVNCLLSAGEEPLGGARRHKGLILVNLWNDEECFNSNYNLTVYHTHFTTC